MPESNRKEGKPKGKGTATTSGSSSKREQDTRAKGTATKKDPVSKEKDINKGNQNAPTIDPTSDAKKSEKGKAKAATTGLAKGMGALTIHEGSFEAPGSDSDGPTPSGGSINHRNPQGHRLNCFKVTLPVLLNLKDPRTAAKWFNDETFRQNSNILGPDLLELPEKIKQKGGPELVIDHYESRNVSAVAQLAEACRTGELTSAPFIIGFWPKPGEGHAVNVTAKLNKEGGRAILDFQRADHGIEMSEALATAKTMIVLQLKFNNAKTEFFKELSARGQNMRKDARFPDMIKYPVSAEYWNPEKETWYGDKKWVGVAAPFTKWILSAKE